mmetsp:Transcript_30078/g.80264  ORF Transcript_30078/g.80264 Transcript_30078/m.80264 type:complete len:222 (+) Transcript_30078:590-1255(+)
MREVLCKTLRPRSEHGCPTTQRLHGCKTRRLHDTCRNATVGRAERQRNILTRDKTSITMKSTLRTMKNAETLHHGACANQRQHYVGGSSRQSVHQKLYILFLGHPSDVHKKICAFDSKREAPPFVCNFLLGLVDAEDFPVHHGTPIVLKNPFGVHSCILQHEACMRRHRKKPRSSHRPISVAPGGEELSCHVGAEPSENAWRNFKSSVHTGDLRSIGMHGY